MIISHKYKFIFVKTAKTAGTSIEVFLSRHCGPLDVVTPIIPAIDVHTPRNHEGYFNHIPACRIRDQVTSDIWDTYFKFCVERNPWEKALSHFHMIRARGKDRLTLDRYLSESNFPINYPKYTDPGNPMAVIVDEVLHYERLMDDLGRVFGALGVPFEGSLEANAKSEYKTDRRHYRDIYSPSQAAIVEKAFSHELLLHGYKF